MGAAIEKTKVGLKLSLEGLFKIYLVLLEAKLSCGHKVEQVQYVVQVGLHEVSP